jgi:hypothetical protein
VPNRLPIKAAREVAHKYGLSQVIITAWDGQRTHVVTYGTTVEQCEQAAVGGNKIKRWLGFPEQMCNAVPRRARTRKKNHEQR